MCPGRHACVKAMYRMEIEMTRSGESLHNELSNIEKPEVPGTQKKKKKNGKTQSQTELRKPCEVEMSFILVHISYKYCGLFVKV
jgi:hypothetical protein